MMSTVAFAQANTQTNRGGTPGFNPNSSQGTATTPRSTTQGSESPSSQGVSSAASELVEMNAAEVAVGKTAASKAQNAEVKSFANMMVKDHTAALGKLKDVEGVTTTDVKPNAKHQATADRLSKLSGAEFDREYMSAMVTDHEEALSFLERQSKQTNSGSSSSNAGKKSLAKVSEDLIPTVRQHLQQAQKIQKDLGNNSQSSSKSSSGTNSNTGNTNNTNRSTTTPAGGNR